MRSNRANAFMAGTPEGRGYFCLLSQTVGYPLDAPGPLDDR
jgi:hypothetical protein